MQFSSIQECLKEAAYKLQEINVDSPHLEARILLQYVIDKPLEYLLMHLGTTLTNESLKAFAQVLDRRLKHEPIAYIVGIKEFYSREFIVNKHVLIPRPDTELLINVVMQKCNSTPNILELGTGSGCIAISLLCELSAAKIIATDISREAIEVARNNALKHKVADRMQIIHSNWFENLENQKFDFIVSNPPYISQTEKSHIALETINYEPFLALFAEEDGLQAYRVIAKNAKKFLKLNGKIVLEIGFNQAEKVSKIFLNYGYVIDHVYKDLQGHDRVIVICLVHLNKSYSRCI